MARGAYYLVLRAILTLSAAFFTSGDQFGDMVQMAKYHHEGLERTLRDLKVHVDALPTASPDMEVRILKQLQDLSSLTQSVHSFCQVFQQNSNSTSSVSSAWRAAGGDKTWHRPVAALVPLSVKMNRHSGASSVEFTVRQLSAGYIEPTLVYRYLGLAPRQNLRMKPSKVVPRITTASFEFDTEEFCSANDSRTGVGFSFVSKNRRGPMIDVMVDVCGKGDKEPVHRECVRKLLPTVFSYKYRPNKERIVANPGENTTLTLEIQYSSIPGDDPRPSSEPVFYVSTFAYNRDTGNLTTSFVTVYKKVQENSTVGIRYLQSYPPEESEQPFTDVWEIVPDRDETPDLLASKKKLESANLTAAFLKLHFNTAAGDRSALVIIEQINFCPFDLVSATRAALPVRVLQKGQRHPIPRGTIEFLPRGYHSCDVLDDGSLFNVNECVVQCRAIGSNIIEMTLTKKGEQYPEPQDLLITREPMWTKATLYLGKAKMHFAGTYECRAKNTVGYEAVHSINLIVNGPSKSNVSETMQEQ